MTRNETPNPRRPARRERPHTDALNPLEASSSASPHKPERQRIAKTMARAGLCSRRDAESWILAGRVSVNGEVLASPARDVAPDDNILVDGEPLPTAEKTRLFLFHKPRGLVTSDHDPEGRETVADFLRENWPEGPRTVTIGRLDINTEGLLLLTNDGGLARILELPETGWLRRYRVRAKGETDQAALDALADGIEIDGIEYAGIEAKLDRLQGSNCWLTMGLREGKNREIKRVLEHIGLEVNRLIRLSFGPFQLLDLPEGAVEEVRTRVLREQLGENLSAAAGVDFGDQETAARSSDRGRADPRGAEAQNGGRNDSGEVGAEQTRAARGRLNEQRLPAAKGAPLSLPSLGSKLAADRDQRSEPEAPVLERQERQKDGPRRHVSALRGGDGAAGRSAPRKRIERTATKDRHDRPVAVERLITRDEAPRSTGRKRASPAAEGKRVRVARSGGDTAGRRGGEEAYGGRNHRSEASFRDRNGAPRTSGKPPVRRRPEDGERPARTAHEGGERPRRERPGEGRSQSAPRQERTRSVDDRPARKFGESGRAASRSDSRDNQNAREQRPERSARGPAPAARERFKPRSGGAPSGRPSAGRPSSGKLSFGKPAPGKPSSGRPSSGKPSAGKPRDRPGGSSRPKR